MESAFTELRARLAEISDLSRTEALLEWDQQVMMPPRGTAARAEMRATISRLAHEKLIDPHMGHLLETLQPFEGRLPHDSDEASLIRVVRRDYDKARRVPADLQAEMTRTAALAMEAWVEARKCSDFALFEPHLAKIVALKHRYVACFEPTAQPYDILLDDFEPGMRTSEVKALFDQLKAALVPLVAAISRRVDEVNDACLHSHFAVGRQHEFCLSVVSRFGYEPTAWRLDPTVHPFQTNFATSDIRITTRYHEDAISGALFGTMHECGHGLYEAGVAPSLERTPLCQGASMSLHESQSRMWENLVGRSRPFWRYFYPRLREVFPEQFGQVAMETFYRAINKVQPSLIRVEADEATYGLHIILRFELEQEIIAGTLALCDLPEAWNARMKDYLGVLVPNDAQGVLQDVHWSTGAMGYFPTYALGNIIAAQIWEKVQQDIPDLDARFEQGEFDALREWLRERLHRHGRKFTTAETLQRVVGGPIDVRPYVRYLWAKYGEIYGIP